MINYDKLAQEYVHHRRVHPEVLKSLITQSDVKSNSCVLEIGCGTGNYISALHQETGASSWGIDPSTQMLELARKQSKEIIFKEGFANALEFKDNMFDFAFSVDVIHHLDNVVSYFSEVFRVLHPGGKICTVTDSEDIIRNRRPLAFYFPDTIEVDINRYPSIFILRKQMEDVGFREIQHNQVDLPYELTDARAYRDKAFSCLHLIPDKVFREGLARMEADLTRGPIQCNSRYSLLWGKKRAPIVYL